MKHVWLLAAVVPAMLLFAASGEAPSSGPQYNPDNKLLRPENYREWIFLSAGFDMNYSPMAGDHHMFTNVFVPPAQYHAFLATGKWPERSIFVVEERGAESRGSINKQGHYQVESMGIGVEVKDETRFPDKWAYFSFGEDGGAAEANPKNACWQCHQDHAAVEHTFVQFYPTLKPVAKKFGSYNQSREKVADAE